jgi:hypothetical protein
MRFSEVPNYTFGPNVCPFVNKKALKNNRKGNKNTILKWINFKAISRLQ